jgi:hypothetical protein
MNDDCMEMRRRIESSIGYALEPDERDEIERHCAACEPCRGYRERLLADDSRLAEFAAPRDESIGRVQARAIERVHATDWAPRGQAGRVVARIPRFAAVAAAAAATMIVAFVAIDLIRGAANGPVPVFAAVLEKMKETRNVEYRIVRWKLGEWATQRELKTSSGLLRIDYGDSIVAYVRPGDNARDEYHIFPEEKRAIITRLSCSSCGTTRTYDPAHHRGIIGQKWNPVDHLAAWHKTKGFVFVRKERRDGRSTAVYEHTTGSKRGSTSRTIVWVDLETQLPLRIEIVTPQPGPEGDSHPYGLRLSDFRTESSPAASWIDLGPEEPSTIWDDFRWDALSDTSLGGVIPIAGYDVDTIGHDWDSCGAVTRNVAHNVVWHLSKVLVLTGEVFPDDFQDFADSTKVKQLLLAKFRRGGDPAVEFRSACQAARWLEIPLLSREHQESLHIETHYTGKGAVLGDSGRIVYWIKDKVEPSCAGKSNKGPYYLIYGDLRIVPSSTPPKLVGE